MAKKKENSKPIDKMKFEEAMEELEGIVGQMEEGGLTLEESIDKFERGVRLSQVCAKQLEKAELKVEKLIRRDDGQLRVEPFEDEADETESDEVQEEKSDAPPEEGLLF